MAFFLKKGAVNTLLNNDVSSTAEQISTILLGLNIGTIVSVFLLFFLFGYLFYSAMYAAIGAMVDSDTETQQFSIFAIVPLMMGVYGSISAIANPQGDLAFWLSIIPFTSPVAMVARISFGVPLWQIILSLILLIGSSFLMVFLASKIYRKGILSHGNKANFATLWKWLK